jgi:hypothetical protein
MATLITEIPQGIPLPPISGGSHEFNTSPMLAGHCEKKSQNTHWYENMAL